MSWSQESQLDRWCAFGSCLDLVIVPAFILVFEILRQNLQAGSRVSLLRALFLLYHFDRHGTRHGAIRLGGLMRLRRDATAVHQSCVSRSKRERAERSI